MIPPRTRRLLSNTLTSTLSFSKTGAWIGGKGLWVLTTGAVMLSVPFAVCMVEEQQIVEQEREMKGWGRGRGRGRGGVGCRLMWMDVDGDLMEWYGTVW